MVTWLIEPEIGACARLLADHLHGLVLAHRSLLLIGRCSVDYQGRAESTLGPGDRVVLVKSDGTLLLHNPDGLKPVNWQPPGCSFSSRIDAGQLVLEAVRRQPPELVRIRFSSVQLAGVALLEDGAPLRVRGTEFDIRDTLRSRPELVEAGFVPWERERITERGAMDLYGEDAQGHRVVVEVKRTPAGIAEATQLWRYVEKERTKRGVEVRGILVAPTASARALQLLADHGLEFKAVSLQALQHQAVPLARAVQPSLSDFVQPIRDGREKQTGRT